MPKISIIVPIYKAESYLCRCVNSIQRQTYPDFEIILINDGSPDNCNVICNGFATLDKRVRVIHQANGGLSAARNTGINWAFSSSNSEYLTFIDADDWVEPTYLEELMRGAEMSGGISCVGYRMFYGDMCISGGLHGTWCLMSPEEYWVEGITPMTAWGKLYPKRFFKNLRYPVGRIHEDEYVTHRLLFQSSELAVNGIGLYGYFRHTDSITGRGLTERSLDMIDGFKDQIAFFSALGYTELVEYTEERLRDAYESFAQELGHSEFQKELDKYQKG